MGIQVQRTETQPLPAGLYAASIDSVTQETGKFGEQLKVKFLIEEDGFEGKTLTGWASLTFSPKAKLFGWVKAAVFGGREIPDSYQIFDADHLIGRRVFLSVDTAKGDNGEVWNKIKDLLPYRVAKAQPSAAQPAKPAPSAQRAPAAKAQPTEPTDWTELDVDTLRDPGPTDEDEE